MVIITNPLIMESDDDEDGNYELFIAVLQVMATGHEDRVQHPWSMAKVEDIDDLYHNLRPGLVNTPEDHIQSSSPSLILLEFTHSVVGLLTIYILIILI